MTRVVYTTPEYRIGKHRWRISVVMLDPGPDIPESGMFAVGLAHTTDRRWVCYEWCRGAEPDPYRNDLWRDYHDWPTYNFNDGTYAGCPKSIAKLYEKYKADIEAALLSKPIYRQGDVVELEHKGYRMVGFASDARRVTGFDEVQRYVYDVKDARLFNRGLMGVDESELSRAEL